jgi:hypothetical protein
MVEWVGKGRFSPHRGVIPSGFPTSSPSPEGFFGLCPPQETSENPGWRVEALCLAAETRTSLDFGFRRMGASPPNRVKDRLKCIAASPFWVVYIHYFVVFLVG